jgi:hypothetical protein
VEAELQEVQVVELVVIGLHFLEELKQQLLFIQERVFQ